MIPLPNACRALQYLWAAPATFAGLFLVALAWQGGTRWRWHDGVLEVSSPRIAWWLGRAWHGGSGFAAVTLGHVVLGRCEQTLARCRVHERAHVRQFERWGLLLLPAYLVAGVLARIKGGDSYFDNHFEVQARAAECAPQWGQE